VSWAYSFLSECLVWPIDEHNPGGAKCLVIFLGHAVDNELHMPQQELGVDATVLDNVVAIVDTQTIANEQGVYGRGNKIGLENLINRYNVDFREGHTASNDAAYTVIAAMQMVMQTQILQAPKRSLQEVVNDLEVVSQETNPG
jgi:DNA polymerase III alpha subunit (gram-positive type)